MATVPRSLSEHGPDLELDDLLSTIQQLAFARGLDEVMTAVRSAARRLTGADGVTFVLRENDQCFYADEDAISPLWNGCRFPMSTCISGWAMLHRETVIVPDIFKDDRIPHDVYRLTFVKSLMMVPVRREDPVGAIGAYWADPHTATTRERQIVESLANAAAVALTNASLYLSLKSTAEEARRQAEAAEAARREAQRISEQKSRFLAACSHDLRQPFQAMRLFHAVLGGRLTDEARSVHDRLGLAMGQGEQLLQSIVGVARIEAGQTKFEPRPVPVTELWGLLAKQFAEKARDRGLSFTLLPCDAVVRSDPEALHPLLSCLVDNAIKFTAAGGVTVRARPRGATVALQVWDSGIGIPHEARADIFEDFYQLANPERDRARGIGLGLGIVRRLSWRMSHPVTVHSRPGRGSLFSVLVPAA